MVNKRLDFGIDFEYNSGVCLPTLAKIRSQIHRS